MRSRDRSLGYGKAGESRLSQDLKVILSVRRLPSFIFDGKRSLGIIGAHNERGRSGCDEASHEDLLDTQQVIREAMAMQMT